MGACKYTRLEEAYWEGFIMERRLYKTKDGAMLAGVCAGIAEYLSIDVTLVRIGFVLVALAGGSGVLAYLLAAIIMPDKWQVSGGTGFTQTSTSATPTARPAEKVEEVEEVEEEIGLSPEDSTDYPQHKPKQAVPQSNQDNQRLLAYILIGIGVWIIVERYVNFRVIFRHWWPLLLVGIGVVMLTGNWNRRA